MKQRLHVFIRKKTKLNLFQGSRWQNHCEYICSHFMLEMLNRVSKANVRSECQQFR